MAKPISQARPAPEGSPETSSRILEAAAELFSVRGFARTTIRQIAERASANSALIYYYFGSKGGLLEALVGRMQALVHANLERSMALEGTPREKLERFIRLQVELMRQRSPLLRILLREVLNQNELVLGAMRRAIELNLGLVRSLIREGVEAGEFRETDELLAAQTLIGSLMMPVVIAPLVLGEEEAGDPGRLPDHIVDMYMRGLVR